MSLWQKIRIALMMALLAGFAGTTFAAVAAQAAGSSGFFSNADTPSQSQGTPPVDCKKTPDDPRCKNKPY